MEYYTLTVRTGAPGYIDAKGGVHVQGFPQLIKLSRDGVLKSMCRKLFGDGTTDRSRCKSVKPSSVFSDEFMVEVPLDVDVSSLTGVKSQDGTRLRFSRTQSVYDRPEDIEDDDALDSDYTQEVQA